MMKELAKSTLLGLYKYSGALAVQERISYWLGTDFFPILLFHRVTDAIPPDGLTVSTAWFRRLCRLLRERFQVVAMSEAMRLVESRQRLPRRLAVITFDDCYHDNLFAARILAEHELPACFFIPTAFPGTDHVFAWDRGLRPMPNLSWDDIRELAALGHEIGSHTVHHMDLSQLSREETSRELVVSKQTLEKHLGQPVHWFAFPFGRRANFPEERLPLVYEAGYRACFSGCGGFVYPARKEQILPRIPVPNFSSLLNLELYLSGCLGWVYSLKRKIGMICT